MKTVLRTAGEHSVHLIAVLCAGLLVAPGCQSPGPGPDLIRAGSRPFAPGNAALDGVAAEQELAEARRMLQAGEHSRVIPRLMDITTEYAGTKAATEAWYVLGLTYYKIDGLYNAEQYFRKYLSLAPDGDFAALCREYLAGIESAAEQRGAARAALESRVAKYNGVAAPEELAASLELAETYWHDGDFEKASAVYVRVLRTWPSLKNDTLIRRRMELGPDGQYTVLTPDEAERRQSAAEPLTVFNVQSFRSGRYRPDQYSYVDEYYNVAGQAVNRSEQALLDVSVIVTIYGLAGQVYDTQTVQLGRLKPGEVRAFSVRFSNFDNIENVHRHECTVTYSQ
jgi:tetratricopeptide (TPR) repeat protein